MDISAFSDDNFDSVKWINKSFASMEEGENKEAQISSVVTKLQLYVQQVNSALEETSQQVLQSMPRIIHETEKIQNEALILKSKMSLLREEIVKIEKGTDASMAVLEKLDEIKTSLQKTKEALQEADNWTVLANEMEDVFEGHDIELIASKIVSMQQSLVVLAGAHDFEKKRLQLEGFKSRLEAVVSPYLVTAMTANNVDDSKKYVRIFEQINKDPIKYYNKCQMHTICHQWSTLVEIDQDSNSLQLLNLFYDFLLSNWHVQVKWCQSVLKSSSCLLGIYCEAIDAVSPNIVSLFESDVKQQPQPLLYLIQLKQASGRFFQTLQTAVLNQGWNVEESIKLYASLMSIFQHYILNYGQLELTHLNSELPSSPQAPLLDVVQGMSQRNASVISSCTKAITRCQLFTDSIAVHFLVQSVKTYLLNYIDEYKVLMKQIDVEKSNKEEWTLFKICLTLLQKIGELSEEIRTLDRAMLESISKYMKEEKKPIISFLTGSSLQEHNKLLTAVKHEADKGVLEEVVAKVDKWWRNVCQSCVEAMVSQVGAQLGLARAWWQTQSSTSQQMPDYSYAPLHYITQIGEYIMTLPQYLEPFMTNQEGGSQEATDLILGAVAKQTCALYTDLILSLSHLSPHSARQLAVDIGYLASVLDDLGYVLTETLGQLHELIQIPMDRYQESTSGFNPYLVASVRQLRNISPS